VQHEPGLCKPYSSALGATCYTGTYLGLLCGSILGSLDNRHWLLNSVVGMGDRGLAGRERRCELRGKIVGQQGKTQREFYIGMGRQFLDKRLDAQR
jgi:hypothetical protein